MSFAMIYSKLMIDRSVRSGLGSVEYAYRYDDITNMVKRVRYAEQNSAELAE